MKVQIIFSKYFLKNIFGEQKSFCFSIAQGLLKVFYFLKIFLFASPPAWKGINKLINFFIPSGKGRGVKMFQTGACRASVVNITKNSPLSRPYWSLLPCQHP